MSHDASVGRGQPPVVTVDPMIADLVPGYLASRRDEVEGLRELCARQDLEGLRLTGHRLRGSGAGYGFPVLSDIGGRIEDAAGAGDLAAIERAIAEYAIYLAEVRVIGAPVTPG